MTNKTDTACKVEAESARGAAEQEPWEARKSWRESLPGYDLLAGRIPSRMLYRVLVAQKIGRTIWMNLYFPRRRWMQRDKDRHRIFCAQLLAQTALANGWTEEQARYLLVAWRQLHQIDLHDVQLEMALAEAQRKSEPIREEYRKERESKIDAKTSFRVFEYVMDQGPVSPAAVARELNVPRERVKKSLQRLVKAGHLLKRGRGEYMGVPQAGTFLGTEKRKNKKTNSIPQDVPVVPPEPLSPEEQYWRSIKWEEREDGTCTVTLPEDESEEW